MQKLIEDLLRYSRISSLAPEMEPVDLREVVNIGGVPCILCDMFVYHSKVGGKEFGKTLW